MSQRLHDVFRFFENELPKKYEELNGSREIRTSQVQMAVNVAGILSSNSKAKAILIDAPVGTGKTFAVLAPAAYKLKESGNRIIYATSSLNLQAQLKNEELSILKKMGYINSFIVAKGQTHYICKQRLNKRKMPNEIYDALMNFCDTSLSGERTEFEQQYFQLEDDIWGKIQLENQSNCKHCDVHFLCPTYEHRRNFNSSKNQVVVTNHNQLIQSVLNKINSRKPIIDYYNAGIIIIDEAHDFEDACLNQISNQMPLNLIISCMRKSKLNGQILKNVDKIKRETSLIRNKLQTAGGRHNLTPECISALKKINELLKKQLATQAMNDLDKLYKSTEQNELDFFSEVIENALNKKQYASWLDIDEYKESLVVVDRNFNSKTREIINSLLAKNRMVFTSGTLAVEGKFDHLYYSWGGKPLYSTTKILDTVFQYSKQAMVYLPKDIPEPPGLASVNFEDYCRDLSEEILRLIKITGGRTLILATSYKQMESLYSLLQPALLKLDINFLKQGTKSIELLTEEFKNDETSTLIGTGSFFAGLSVKGNSLISVILCKLPFPPKDDPFLELIAEGCSRREKMDLIDFPRMLVKLLQAGGRLIRSIEDFGCFSILDPRIHNKFYSDKIIEQLKNQNYQITSEFNEVKQFIFSRIGKQGFASYPKFAREIISIPDSLQKEEKDIVNWGSEQQPKFNYNDSKFNSKQWNFYKDVRKKAGLDNRLLKSISSQYKMCKYLYDLASKKNLDIDVLEEFPYISEEQAKQFRITILNNKDKQNTEVKTYYLSPQEIKEKEKEWKV